MKKLSKLIALTMTAGLLLAACGDANDSEEEPETEQPAGGGMGDGLEDVDE